MLKRIWQWLVRWFRYCFRSSRSRNPTPPTVHQQPPPLSDTDYEFLFIQLLEGLAHGWQQARVSRFFEVLSERGKQDLWVGWLQRFGERLLASPVPNNELAARMVQLGELGCGEIAEVAYEIGMQLHRRLTQTHRGSPSVNGGNEGKGDSQVTEAAEVQSITLDKLLVRLQQDANLVQQFAQQLGIETTDPQVIIRELINQLNAFGHSTTDEAEAWLYQGLQQYEAGDVLRAIASVDKAIEIKPNLNEAWYSRGNALYKLGRYEEAITSYDNALKIKPGYHEVWNNRGLALKDLGSLEEAIASYDNILKIKPDDHEVWSNRGVAFEELGRYEEAIANYYKAIEFKPDFHQAWNNWGDALNKLYLYEEAISKFDSALQIKLDNWQSWIGRGIAAVNSVDPDPRLTSLIAQNNPALNQRSYEGQVASYEEGLKYVHQDTHPEGWGRLHWAIGKAHYFRGRQDSKPFSYWHKAVAEYNEALTTLTEPEARLEVLQDLIKALLGLRETAKAEELGRHGTDLLQRLLDDSKSPGRKKQLTFKFAEFNQLTVDLAVQSGNWCAALELAEQGKNACLSWLLYAESDKISSPSWSKIQQLLNPTTSIIYWHLSPVALTTFILKHNAPSPIVITTPTSTNEEGLPARVQRLREFEDWIKDWNQQYTDYRSKAKDEQSRSKHSWRVGMEHRLKNLKNILNIPAIEQELKGITQLILIPHRDLHRFPLHALFTNNSDFTIAYLPSAQTGINLQKRQPNTTNHMLSVEAPTSKGVASLGFAQIESEAISQMFDKPKRIQSEHATKKQVEDALSNEYSVFHFTGHGTYNFSNPKKSELVLADEDKLTLEEICQNNLTSYNLVSLSACETAITGNQTITAEYVGLVSGFMSRGVAHVVSTLWTVESTATALVMIEFYRRRRTDKSEATALAEATQWLRHLTVRELKKWYEAFLNKLPPDEEGISDFLETELYRTSRMEPDKKLYDHPYYWVAFIITGKLY